MNNLILMKLEGTCLSGHPPSRLLGKVLSQKQTPKSASLWVWGARGPVTCDHESVIFRSALFPPVRVVQSGQAGGRGGPGASKEAQCRQDLSEREGRGLSEEMLRGPAGTAGLQWTLGATKTKDTSFEEGEGSSQPCGLPGRSPSQVLLPTPGVGEGKPHPGNWPHLLEEGDVRRVPRRQGAFCASRKDSGLGLSLGDSVVAEVPHLLRAPQDWGFRWGQDCCPAPHPHCHRLVCWDPWLT